jgi:hypothetical protein
VFRKKGADRGGYPSPTIDREAGGGVLTFAFAFDVALDLAGRVQAVTPSPANSPPGAT